jgi:hypothetical protein
MSTFFISRPSVSKIATDKVDVLRPSRRAVAADRAGITVGENTLSRRGS